MAFSLRKTSSGGTIGLDIDGRYLAAAQVANGRVTQSASHELPEGLVRDGEVADVQALAEQLKTFASNAGLPKNVRLGVANQQIVVRVIELPRIEDEKQRDAAVRFQASEAIAMPLDEAVLDLVVKPHPAFTELREFLSWMWDDSLLELKRAAERICVLILTDDYPEIDNEFSGVVHTVQINLGEENPSTGDGGVHRRIMTSR